MRQERAGNGLRSRSYSRGMHRLRTAVIALLATGALAGCGDELDNANEEIDRRQEQVDRARDAVEDPIGTAKREADRALEDAITPQDQP